MTDHDLAYALLSDMVRVRHMEEKCAELYGEAKIRGFLHLYVGEEAVATGSLRALTPDDAVVATYREHAHALLRGMPMTSIMAEMFGKQEGCSRGRGGSMHLFDAATGDDAARFRAAFRQGGAGARGGFTASLDALTALLHEKAQIAARSDQSEAAAGFARAIALVEDTKRIAQQNANPQLLTANLLMDLAPLVR